MTSMTSPGSPDRRLVLDLLGDSVHRLTRTVDAFRGDDWRTPSLLPGWSRAHVVAHLALNAEGMTRALHGLVADEQDGSSPMYDSDDKRDGDIDDLARAHHHEIRDRFLGSATVLHDAFAAVPEAGWDGRVDRTPGGRSMRV